MADKRESERYAYAQDDKYNIYKEYTKVTKENGDTDRYVDTILVDKETGEERKTEHISYHNSGATNHDYIADCSTAHIHERADGSTYKYDEYPNGDKDYGAYEDEDE